MKAAVLEEVKKLVVKEVPDPICGDGDVIVKVEACAICGADIRTYNFGHKNIILPHILGHEIAGIIVETGKGVSNFKTGDRVNVFPAIACNECDWCRRGMQVRCDNTIQIGDNTPGGFAEYVRIPAKAVSNGSLVRIPEGVSYEEAALAEPLGCVLNGQELSEVKLNDVVLVIGAGPIGCMHIMLAKARGASKVILADVNDSRLELAKSCGAEYLINSKKENLGRKLLEYTNGKKADVVIIACNVKSTVAEALDLLDWGGRLSVFAGMPKDDPVEPINLNTIHYMDLKVVGSYGSNYWQHVTATNLISNGQISAKKLISKTYPLEEINKALEDIRQGNCLKVVIKP